MRAVIDIKVKASSDASQRRILFNNEEDTSRPQTVDVWQRAASGLLEIVASGTEQLPLGDVGSPTGVYLRLSGNADLVFNGGSDTLNIRVPTTSLGTPISGSEAHMYLPISFTSLSITNASPTTALTAEYFVVGDPA